MIFSFLEKVFASFLPFLSSVFVMLLASSMGLVAVLVIFS